MIKHGELTYFTLLINRFTNNIYDSPKGGPTNGYLKMNYNH